MKANDNLPPADPDILPMITAYDIAQARAALGIDHKKRDFVIKYLLFGLMACLKEKRAPAGSHLDLELAIKRLYQRQRLSPEHINVLNWYGTRRKKPNRDIIKERRSAYIWMDAICLIEAELTTMGKMPVMPEREPDGQPKHFRTLV